jgi:hypothetical protein
VQERLVAAGDAAAVARWGAGKVLENKRKRAIQQRQKLDRGRGFFAFFYLRSPN